METPMELRIKLSDFKKAAEPFTKKRLKMTAVTLSFDNGQLIFEAGPIAVKVPAEGNWIGRVLFAPEILRAMAMVPPKQDPIIIAYENGRLSFGGVKISCQEL